MNQLFIILIAVLCIALFVACFMLWLEIKDFKPIKPSFQDPSKIIEMMAKHEARKLKGSAIGNMLRSVVLKK